MLGAHAVPPEYDGDREGYVRLVAEEMVPVAASAGLGDACDVYCDAGAFTLQETRTILSAAREHGLGVRAHVGQFEDLGGAELGGWSRDHLEAVSDAGLRAMAEKDVRAVLLPGAWRTLRQSPPDAARMLRHGVKIAVGTDANPGTSPALDLVLCASLAVRDAGLPVELALLAITAHAADAIGARERGRITHGGPADVVLWEAASPDVFCAGTAHPTPRDRRRSRRRGAAGIGRPLVVEGADVSVRASGRVS